jgi:hypothetical protein
MKRSLLPLLTVAALAAPLCAEEGGSGHYTPGATASFVDALLDKPGWAYANQGLYYGGDFSGKKGLPLGANLAGNVDATSYADINVLLYQSDLQLFGGYYAACAAIPFVRMDIDVSGALTGPRGRSVTRQTSDRAEGLGDIYLAPFMLGWKKGDLKYDARLGFYAPTGEYDKNDLANVGKNYWTLEPAVSLSYLGSKNGIEVTTFAGVDFNSENQDTDYQTGEQVHLDMTVAQHLPLGKAIAGVGANGFYYQQVTGDSSDTSRLGDFKARTAGVGPVLSYATKVSGHDLVLEVKWLPELDVEHRLEGDYVWVKAAVIF